MDPHDQWLKRFHPKILSQKSLLNIMLTEVKPDEEPTEGIHPNETSYNKKERPRRTKQAQLKGQMCKSPPIK